MQVSEDRKNQRGGESLCTNTQATHNMKYLVAVDGSEHALKAMDLACKLMKEGDELVLLTIVDEYSAADMLDEDTVLVAGA